LPALLAGEPVTYLLGDALRERVKRPKRKPLPPIVPDEPDDDADGDAAADDGPEIELTADERLALFAPRVAAGV
ncbi:MAG: hypothetical protein WBC44_05835, partial [Planctomycetaceae bacterium]